MDKRLSPVILCVLALMVFALPASVLAAPPPNDDFANAMVIPGLPFSDTQNTTEATTAPDDPLCFGSGPTVWYKFTPTQSGRVEANAFGSDYLATIFVYSGAPGALTLVTCSDGGPFQAVVRFDAAAGTTYFIVVGSHFGESGNLVFSMNEVLPPANDNFPGTTIGGLPFDDIVDIAGATIEAGEPIPSCGAPSGTVWYAFTPPSSGSLSASFSDPFPLVLTVYTGNSFTTLTQVGCVGFGLLTFQANAATTYYFQAGHFGQGGTAQFHLEVTPPAVAQFGFSPFDPSVFDTVQFFDQSFDPGQAGIQSQAWDFGDGATATGCCPTHQYAADGDYTVQLTVTTVDGRTASTSQVVQVRTHDVAITKFTAPKSASAGQTRRISAGINSKRLPENVEVRLFKSVPGGFQEVGVLTQSVPVRPSNRTTQFGFSYTFTNDDANVGKVTFKAVATIVGARDALPADNEAIASPTKVR